MTSRTRLLIAAALLAVMAAVWSALPGGSREAQGELGPWSRPLVDRDLRHIEADTLRVLVVEHPLTHVRWAAAESGAEYELLERFAIAMRIPVRAVVVQHRDSLVPMLQRGEGDVIAAQWREGHSFHGAIALTEPYRHVQGMLAMLRADRTLGIREGDIPDTVLVGAGSPLIEPYEPHCAIGPHALLPHPDKDGPSLLEQLAIGQVGHVLLTDAEARHAAELFPQVSFGEPVGAQVGLVFAVRRNAPRLRQALDRWLADPLEAEARGWLLAAYGDRIKKRGPLGSSRRSPVREEGISPFDSLFQEKAVLMHWEWELLAAIAFKESRFDTAAVSVRGAQGLMQMMPRTAARIGADSLHLVEGQVHAAAVYLAMLDSVWMRSIPDVNERLHFVLASYNAGPGHVQDARRLADQLGLDRGRWLGHVERAITLLALPQYFLMPGMTSGRCKGSQTFLYVREVLGLYRHYGQAREGQGS